MAVIQKLSPWNLHAFRLFNTPVISKPSGKIIKTTFTLAAEKANKNSDKDRKDKTDSEYTRLFDKISKDDKIYKDAFETLSKKFNGKIIDLI
ncbi:MAG: hypothetical protein LBH37_04325 [Oscillospiraceae bacterium]|nr:hypothetical protein [Oscillospiraceae bacterium]